MGKNINILIALDKCDILKCFTYYIAYFFLPHTLHLDMLHKHDPLLGNLVDTHLHRKFPVQIVYLHISQKNSDSYTNVQMCIAQ